MYDILFSQPTEFTMSLYLKVRGLTCCSIYVKYIIYILLLLLMFLNWFFVIHILKLSLLGCPLAVRRGRWWRLWSTRALYRRSQRAARHQGCKRQRFPTRPSKTSTLNSFEYVNYSFSFRIRANVYNIATCIYIYLPVYPDVIQKYSELFGFYFLLTKLLVVYSNVTVATYLVLKV